jgi:hypothetical protein
VQPWARSVRRYVLIRVIGKGAAVSDGSRVITIRELPPRRPLRWAMRRLPGSQPPFAVTDRALGELESILNQQEGRASQSLGLVREPDGKIGLVLDEPGAGDRLFVFHARTVLFITAEVSDGIAGYVLDYAGDSGLARFKLLPAQD